MVFTLHRYIFHELLKIFILTTFALTLMLSFGNILQPAQRFGAGPDQIINILFYMLPVTLTFVIPISALFAGALVYGRLASDNELDACKASGLSFMTLVYPGLILALLVTIANLALSFYVMPRFIHMAERSLKDDAEQILFRNIQRNNYFKLPPEMKYVIYADYANQSNNTLQGVIVVESKYAGIDRITITDEAKIRFIPRGLSNEVDLIAKNVNSIGTANDTWIYSEEVSTRQEFGSLLPDDIKFKKIHEIKEIRSNLMLFDPVAKLVEEFRLQYCAELLAQYIKKQITTGPDYICKITGRFRTVVFAAGNVTTSDNGTVILEDVVEVKEYDTANIILLRSLIAEKAVIKVEYINSEPLITMDLLSVREQLTNRSSLHIIIENLSVPEGIISYISSENPMADIAPEKVGSALGGNISPQLQALQNGLILKVRKTLAEIKTEIHTRLVFGIGCVPMILIGIGLGVLKRGGHLLSAFAISCIPAVLLIVSILSGKQITENPKNPSELGGLLLMWAGLGILIFLTGIIYHRLLRY